MVSGGGLTDGPLDCVAVIVDYDDDGRQALTEQGAELGRGLLHGRVADDQHDAPVRCGQRRAQGGRQGPADRRPQRLADQLGPVGQGETGGAVERGALVGDEQVAGEQEVLHASPQAPLGEQAAGDIRRGVEGRQVRQGGGRGGVDRIAAARMASDWRRPMPG